MTFETVALARTPTEDEWYSIAVFKERVEEVIRQLQRLRLGHLSFTFSRKPDATYEVTGDIPSDDDLRLLYFEFRHLYAEREPGNFMRVAKIIARCAGTPSVDKCMKHLRKESRSHIVEDGIFHDKGRNLSGRKLVDVWFNAKAFHSDRDRRRELVNLNKWLGIQGVRVLLFITIYDAILAAKNLYYLIKDMQTDHVQILLPKEFLKASEGNSL